MGIKDATPLTRADPPLPEAVNFDIILTDCEKKEYNEKYE